MIAKDVINDISTRIVKSIDPEKIILFGSYAKGNFREDSDLDLIIVKDSKLPRHKRGKEIRRLFYGLLVPMDLKVYTPDEFKSEIKNKYSFLSKAIKESKLLYERKAGYS
jgi:predicted nucleotidyltransferase